jgi:DNA primase
MEHLQQKRGLSLDSITKFQLGLFPQDLRKLFKVADPKELRSAGIIRHASASPFKNQDLVMPIRDIYGNYIALAGRTRLSEKEREEKGIAKYRNSVYKKSHHMFGLNFAKRSILENNVVYIVEGYFDVITPHQHGLENVVATCGAFLTTRHIVLLSRYTTNLVLIMDNEEQAQETARKTIERKGREGINLSFANFKPVPWMN